MENQEFETQLMAKLTADGKLRDMDMQKISLMREENNESSFISLIGRLGVVGDVDLAKSISEILNLPLLSKLSYPSEPIEAAELSVRFLKEHNIVPLSFSNHLMEVAMANPLDADVCDAVAFANDCKIKILVGSISEIQAAIDKLYGGNNSQMDQIVDSVDVDNISDEEVDHLKDLASEAPVIRLVNLIIYQAVEQKASDIHIEPFEGQLNVRYRIDGVLQEVESPPRQFAAAVISRVKLMAKLNIAERRLPQDGRIRSRIQGQDYDMRISTVPTIYGESVVIRLLNQATVKLDFSKLGFEREVQDQLETCLRQPHGMILITGPTGSGKTTTLYTALNLLNEPNRKIITVEDPIEYQLEGINQIQAKSSIGLTFASALRSIVRQDPDIIMVGEMRDLETAEICIQSALTGHLVLSTLHTNDAASSITRLIDMRVENYLLTSTLHAVVAQRLVRVLCPKCKQKTAMSDQLRQEIELIYGNVSGQTYKSVGCATCSHSGYSGRTTILELLMLDDDLRKQVLENADAVQLQKLAISKGMRTMYQDGLKKVLDGVTTLEEITRVTQN